MDNHQIIKYNNGELIKVSNAIAVTEKLLALVEPQLIPYRKKDKWGFCTPNKEIVIECVYEETNFFIGDTSICKLNNKYGVIDNKGKIIIDFGYDVIVALKNDYFQVKKGKFWGILNQDGTVKIETIYNNIDFFINGKLRVTVAEKDGIIDINNNTIVECKYDYISPELEAGLMIFKQEFEDKEGSYDLYGVLGKNGNQLVAPMYRFIFQINLDCLEVLIGNQAVYVDYKGTILEDKPIRELGNMLYGYIDDYHEDYEKKVPRKLIKSEFSDYDKTILPTENKTGFSVDEQIVIPEIYENVGYFFDGLAAVVLNGKTGFVNKIGELVIPFEYDKSSLQLSNINKENYRVIGNTIAVKRNKKWGMINLSNETIIPFIYNSFKRITKNFSFVENDNEKGIITLNNVKYWED